MLNFWHLNVTILNIVLFIIIFYPIIGGIGWSVGVLCYKYIFKHQQLDWIKLPSEIEPMISIMIPAHNEEVTIKKTVDYLINKLNYSNFEVIVIDDGSNDQTLKILKNLQNQYSNLKVIRIEDNKGKAHALNIGLAFAKGELILSNDADSIPETDALKKYVNYFIRSDAANIAAVTGNIDIHNRDKLVAKSQLVEFSSIVGTIKRTELGVFGAFTHTVVQVPCIGKMH
ncbi:glycosyltransferase family 2 protein [Xylocopilactobacillus apis]|uniref:Glycosyltransferase 2-like domain-containing protein n=1 Tax=Xylocopilactobacillus apis TaxID=2932183 RepID=A0AAU9D5I5_9LACO|nr:hypothetical protein KIMC2_20920 [Xylocopilactobacillus apis]